MAFGNVIRDAEEKGVIVETDLDLCKIVAPKGQSGTGDRSTHRLENVGFCRGVERHCIVGVVRLRLLEVLIFAQMFEQPIF
jgi:hypothetical protein